MTDKDRAWYRNGIYHSGLTRESMPKTKGCVINKGKIGTCDYDGPDRRSHEKI